MAKIAFPGMRYLSFGVLQYYMGLLLKSIWKLHIVQNAVALVVMSTSEAPLKLLWLESCTDCQFLWCGSGCRLWYLVRVQSLDICGPSSLYNNSSKPFGHQRLVPWRKFFRRLEGAWFRVLPTSHGWGFACCAERFLACHRPVPIHGLGLGIPAV